MIREQAPLDTEYRNIDCRTKALLFAIREALYLVLGAIEDYLNIPRTKEGTHRHLK
jgi:hypothetical protein